MSDEENVAEAARGIGRSEGERILKTGGSVQALAKRVKENFDPDTANNIIAGANEVVGNHVLNAPVAPDDTE